MHPLGRHDWPLLRTGHVRSPRGHPHDVILVIQRFIILAELAQPFILSGAVREFAFRVHLVWMIAGHPQLFIHKAQAVIDPLVRGKFGAGRHRVRTACIRDDLVGDRVAHAVLFAGVAQQTNGARVKFLRGLLLRINVVLVDLQGTGPRAACGIRLHFRVHRHQAVVGAIHVQIQTEVVNMLVGRADDVVVDQRAVFCIVFRARVVHGFRHHAFHRFDTGRPGINADGAVFVEHPVEDVVVVPYGTDPAHHQLPTLGADVRLIHLLVFILRPCVAFEDCDGSRDLHRRTGVVRDGLIQQHGVRWHIFAAHQRGGKGAHAVVARVKIGLEVPAHVRVAVRDDHSPQRSFVHNLTFFTVIVEGDGGDNRPDA